MTGDKVLVHTIGPNGVYAKVLSTSYDRVKVKYYDAADGGDIVRWVSVLEIACNQNRDDRSEAKTISSREATEVSDER